MAVEASNKLCECGCGELAPIATKTSTAQGYVKGRAMRFVSHHASRMQSEETRRRIGDTHRGMKRSAEFRREMSAAKFAQSDETRRQISLSRGGTGEPDVTSIHQRLARRHPKEHVCAHCDKEGPTDYAFLRHPEPHTENRADYIELCRGCHIQFDRC